MQSTSSLCIHFATLSSAASHPLLLTASGPSSLFPSFCFSSYFFLFFFSKFMLHFECRTPFYHPQNLIAFKSIEKLNFHPKHFQNIFPNSIIFTLKEFFPIVKILIFFKPFFSYPHKNAYTCMINSHGLCRDIPTTPFGKRINKYFPFRIKQIYGVCIHLGFNFYSSHCS